MWRPWTLDFHPLIRWIRLECGIIQIGFLVVFILAIGQATLPFDATVFVACGITNESVIRSGKQLISFILVEVACALSQKSGVKY